LVLLVEDEMMIALVIEEVIRDAGYDVAHAMTGTEAIAELERRAAEFRVVVTDIQLPGANGWEVARRARELQPRMGLGSVSGDSGIDLENRGLPGSISSRSRTATETWCSPSARRLGTNERNSLASK
jgi:CheY-like chemotaxis protein